MVRGVLNSPFDPTKPTAEEVMEALRLLRQYVFAVVDGIGWKSRAQDLRRIHDLRVQQQIDGLFTLTTLPEFRDEIERAATRLGLV